MNIYENTGKITRPFDWHTNAESDANRETRLHFDRLTMVSFHRALYRLIYSSVRRRLMQSCISLCRSSAIQKAIISIKSQWFPIGFERNLQGFKGIWRNLKEFEEIWRNFEGLWRILKNFEEFEEVSGKLKKFWRFVKNFENFWRNFKRFEGILKIFEEFEEIWRKFEGIWRNLKKFEAILGDLKPRPSLPGRRGTRAEP